MKLAVREAMSQGGTLAEQIAWLEGLGFDGIELHRSRRLQQSPATRERTPRFSTWLRRAQRGWLQRLSEHRV